MKYGFHLRVPHPCQPLGIHVISITSNGPLRGGVGCANEGEGPTVPPEPNLAAQTQGGRAASGDPVRKGATVLGGFLFFLLFVFCQHAEGDRHWLCAVCHRAATKAKGQGQMAWKGRRGWARRKCPDMQDERCRPHVFFIISRWNIAGTVFLPLITVGAAQWHSPKLCLLQDIVY